MDNYNIQIECRGYGFSVALRRENITFGYPNILRLKLSYDELNKIIDALNDLKILIYNNKNETKIS